MRHDDDRPVLAAFDFSDDSRAAVLYAARHAANLGRELEIVHVARFPVPTGPTIMSGQAIRRTLERACAGVGDIADIALRIYPGLPVRTRVEPGEPSDILLNRSSTAFLTVLGACGLGSHAALHRGSVCDRLVSAAHSPVVIVRSTRAGAPPGPGPTIVAMDSPKRGAAAIALATALIGEHPSYLVTLHPITARHGVELHSGGLPLDRLIIRVTDRADLVKTVRDVAAEYHAGLVIVTRDRRAGTFRFGTASTTQRLLDEIECPLAVVGPASTSRQPPGARISRAMSP